MTELQPNSPVPTHIWEFDNWSCEHWDEVKAGKIDKTKSWVQIEDNDEGQSLVVFIDRKEAFRIDASLDQWGTWNTLACGKEFATVAQESGTRSFVGALIAALEVLKPLADHGECEPPTFTKPEPPAPAPATE